jgi:hypothetical protein
MGVRLRICAPVAVTAVLVIALVAASASPASGSRPGHTKKQAERNVLRVAAKRWGDGRIADLLDARTGLLKDNVRSICRGRGSMLQGKRFNRFACVLRPWPFLTRQQFQLMYRALSNTRFQLGQARIPHS